MMNAYGYYHPEFPLQENWKTFEGFIEDMGDSYMEDSTLVRINTKSAHNKENCKWVLKSKPTQKRITLNSDGSSKTISEWARLKRIPSAVLYSRLGLGWSHDDIVNTPYKQNKRVAEGLNNE